MITSSRKPAEEARTSSSRLAWLMALLLVALATPLVGCGGDDTAETGWNTEEPDEEQEQEQDEEIDEETDNQDNDLPDELPDATNDPPVVAVAIDTVVHSPTPMIAGDRLDVECVYYDLNGDRIDYDEDARPGERVLRNPNDAFERRPPDYFAVRAGSATVTCQSPQLGLTDPDPVEIEIIAGPVHTTTTALSDFQIVAGESATATCEAFDAYGNPVHDAEFNLVSDTTGSGIVIHNEEKRVSITTAGAYIFSCHVAGTQELFGDTLEVIPDHPSELLADLIPMQTTYGQGQVITLSAMAQDRFGNIVTNAQIAFEATPAGESFGQGRFRFFENGIYTLSAQVISPTYADMVLYEEVEIVINDSGPTIQCTNPLDNSMVNHAPGTNLLIQGTAHHELGVAEVLVDGNPVTVDALGNFAATIQPRYGMNFVDVVARDTYGEESVRTCTFLVANNWASATNYIDDAVTLRLNQDAIDSGVFNPSIKSLNDLIQVVLNSDDLAETLETQISAGNPYSVSYCNYKLNIQSIDFTNSSPHITSLDLITGGIRLYARVNDLAIRIRAFDGGPWYRPDCLINHTTTVTVDMVEIQLTSDINLVNNLPSLSLREVEFVNSDGVGAGGVYGWLVSIFQGTFQGIIEDTFRDAVAGNFNDLFAGLFSSLDPTSLGTEIEVPRLDNDETLTLDFGARFSYLNSSATLGRMLFGLAPRIVPETNAHSLHTNGVIYPGGVIRLSPIVDEPVSAAVHVTLLNQAMHALWRGGLFHADIGAALFGDDVPDGTSVALNTQLPPVIVLQNASTDATVMLGGMRLSIQYPGLFDDPVSLTLGATASTQIQLANDELSFDDIVLDEFHLSPDEISLNEGSRQILEDFLRDLIQNVLDQSLSAAMPALPIPSFTIPDSMAGYNLTPGDELGLVNPTMEQSNRHLILRSEFGVR